MKKKKHPKKISKKHPRVFHKRIFKAKRFKKHLKKTKKTVGAGRPKMLAVKQRAHSKTVHIKIKPPLLPRVSRKEKTSAIPKIKVVGIGGCGGNVISRMFDYFPKGTDLIAINTDAQDLAHCTAKKKLVIGKHTTKGLGAGMNPDLGRQAAEESREEISSSLAGADTIFLTSGFGGGTGSGATPIVAEIAQELGILTIAIITKPFSFEGVQRAQIAHEALIKLKDHVDSFITVSNDKIFSVIDKDTSLHKAFEAIDEILKNAVLGVTELIVAPGVINVDFADVKAIMQNSGSAIIGVGVASGKERAVAAADAALHSPLLETVIDGAKGVLFSISGHKDMKMSEINEVARMVSENVDPGAKIIFGTYYDRKLPKGQLKVTVIATGFGSTYGRNYTLFSDFEAYSKSVAIFGKAPETSQLKVLKEKEKTSKESVSSEQKLSEAEGNQEEIWEIPTFLRKKGRHKS